MTLEKQRKAKRASLPTTMICSQSEVIDLLRRQLFDDAVKAGWLKPCCTKPNKRDGDTKIYAVRDVEDVQLRILAGEYPTPEKHESR